MVIAILIFVLLTPRRWFNDQPKPEPPTSHSAAIQLIAQNDVTKTRTYRLSATLLPFAKRAQKPSPELEEQTHDILGRSVDDLKGRTFQVGDIQIVLADDGSVTYYDVSVKL